MFWLCFFFNFYLGSAACQKKVDKGLASVAMDWVDKAFVRVATLGDDSVRTLQNVHIIKLALKLIGRFWSK